MARSTTARRRIFSQQGATPYTQAVYAKTCVGNPQARQGRRRLDFVCMILNVCIIYQRVVRSQAGKMQKKFTLFLTVELHLKVIR